MANNLDQDFHYHPPGSWLDYYGISEEQYRTHIPEFYSDFDSDTESESEEEEEYYPDSDTESESEEEEEHHTVKELEMKNSSVA